MLSECWELGGSSVNYALLASKAGYALVQNAAQIVNRKDDWSHKRTVWLKSAEPWGIPRGLQHRSGSSPHFGLF